MNQPRNILFACHRHPFEKNGGAEVSVSIIMKHFVGLGHRVTAYVAGTQDSTTDGILVVGGGLDYQVQSNDIIFSWGRPALEAMQHAQRHHKKFILMVRWWRNVVDVAFEIGNLMERTIPQHVKDRNQPIFDYASAVITNNKYSAKVIEKHYNKKALVSYVPIPGEAEKINNPDGYITIVSPDKGLNEQVIFCDIARHLPGQNFLVVNTPLYDVPHYTRLKNIKCVGRYNDMRDIWKQTKLVLSPVYKNDICGTLRVNIEAQQHGVPVIASDRSGISEKVDNLVRDNAPTQDWVQKIVYVLRDYETQSKQAIENFNNYDTAKQLKVFESVLN